MSEHHHGSTGTVDRFSRDKMMVFDPEVLRAIIRERAHHTIEGWIYRAVKGEMEVKPSYGGTLRNLLEIWKERGLSMDSPDLEWANRFIEIIDELLEGKRPVVEREVPQTFNNDEMIALEKAIFKRRSIRSFKKKKIEPWMIRKIIEAGLWAPHACNLQTVKTLIVDDEEGLEVFRKSEAGGAAVYLVICQDYRAYDFFEHQIPVYNRNYDAAAAAQNMLLMAQALGLGGVWMTFRTEQIDKIKKIYKLPDYMHVSTYIALGWPKEGSLPPGRVSVEETIITQK